MRNTLTASILISSLLFINIVVAVAPPELPFQTGSLTDIQTILGTGFSNLLGGGYFVVLFLLMFGVIFAWKMGMPFELSVIFFLALLLTASGAFVPNWVVPTIIILVSFGVGIGFLKLWRR